LYLTALSMFQHFFFKENSIRKLVKETVIKMLSDRDGTPLNAWKILKRLCRAACPVEASIHRYSKRNRFPLADSFHAHARAICESLRSGKHSELIPVGVGRHFPAGMRILVLLRPGPRLHQKLRMQLRTEVRIPSLREPSPVFRFFRHSDMEMRTIASKEAYYGIRFSLLKYFPRRFHNSGTIYLLNTNDAPMKM